MVLDKLYMENLTGTNRIHFELQSTKHRDKMVLYNENSGICKNLRPEIAASGHLSALHFWGYSTSVPYEYHLLIRSTMRTVINRTSTKHPKEKSTSQSPLKQV